MDDLNQLLYNCTLPHSQDSHTEAQRIFHGRGHAYKGLEHICIDWLPPVILITLFAEEPLINPVNKEGLINQLLNLFPDCRSIQAQHRYQLAGPIEVIWGDAIENIVIKENKLRFSIQLGKSRNTGLFLDMKNGRQWVQNHSKDRRVLNLFAYTCGFSVAAIEGDAESVLNVDLSSPALSIGRKNHQLNNHSLKKIRFEKINIMKSFGRLKKHGPFDLLICDPPTFQKGSVNIIKDYPKIMRRLDEFMAMQSELLLCLNAPELGREFLIGNMRKFAPGYTFMETISPPEVFVDAENKGLKVLYFKR